jgi:hypothetical protein
MNNTERIVPKIPKEEQHDENLQKEIELAFIKVLRGICDFYETLNKITDKL